MFASETGKDLPESGVFEEFLNIAFICGKYDL